jgi:hypothetical protein
MYDPCPELQELSVASLSKGAKAPHGRPDDNNTSHLSVTGMAVSLAATSHLADALIELHDRASCHLAEFPEVRAYSHGLCIAAFVSAVDKAYTAQQCSKWIGSFEHRRALWPAMDSAAP